MSRPGRLYALADVARGERGSGSTRGSPSPRTAGCCSPRAALRSFSFGWLSVILALYLAGRGLSATAIGAVFTATMVEDALLTMTLSTLAARVGAARLMAMTAPLIALGGFLLATAESPWLLVVGAVLGTLSPNGQDAGPFSPLEHSLLPGVIRAGPAVRGFAWYNLVAFASAAAGAASAGLVLGGGAARRDARARGPARDGAGVRCRGPAADRDLRPARDAARGPRRRP